MTKFHSFLWLSNISVCVCVCVYILHIFIHSSVDGHLGCFHILAIVNAAKKAGVCICFQITAFFFFGYTPRSTILDHMVVLFLLFWGTSILFSIVATLIHILTNSERFPFCYLVKQLFFASLILSFNLNLLFHCHQYWISLD